MQLQDSSVSSLGVLANPSQNHSQNPSRRNRISRLRRARQFPIPQAVGCHVWLLNRTTTWTRHPTASRLLLSFFCYYLSPPAVCPSKRTVTFLSLKKVHGFGLGAQQNFCHLIGLVPCRCGGDRLGSSRLQAGDSTEGEIQTDKRLSKLRLKLSLY